MQIFIFRIVLVAGLVTGLCFDSALAQEKIVPDNKPQITMSFAPLVKKVAPAVVNIYTKRTVVRSVANPLLDDPFFKQFFGNSFGFGIPQDDAVGRKSVEGALGSGVIIGEGGLVVTNAHVVRGADQISVALNDGREFEAKLSLMDEPSDLAILRVNTRGAKLPTATLKPSETLEVGDLVLAIGDPFGVGQTVTSGIVSALARSSLSINNYNFFIQTDAAVNPGNSGGPLIAMDGSVVGINTAIYSRSGGSLGIGFAIPSEMVQTVIAAEAAGKTTGKIVRPWLGVTTQTVTNEMTEGLNLATPSGTLISRLDPGSPLAKAGVKVGDVIVTMNGRPIRDSGEMKFRMATVAMGDDAVIGVSRQGKVFEARVKAVPPPEEPARDTSRLSKGLFDGATVSNINPAVATEIASLNQSDRGVVVTGIEPGSTAARFLAVGDVVMKVNGVDIKAVGDLKRALALQASAFALLINRQGQMQQIVVR
ncbi:MAG: protease Do family protein [Micavibrio sp.]|nr:protease Do family protein [Micavibrio sp.]